MPQSRYLTLEEAATFASVKTRTVRTWIAEGRLVAVRMGPRLIRVDRASLEALARPVVAGNPE